MPITTGKVRASYLNVFAPRVPENGGDPKYSVTLLIPKTDTATINAIYAEIEKAKQEGAQKVFGGNVPPGCQIPIYDGDGVRPRSGDAFGEECHGCMVMTASSSNQPVMVDLNKQGIINPADLYSGCYIRANINLYAYNKAGNKGIGCGLNAIQKVEDGEPLTSRVSAEEAFGGGNTYGAAPATPSYGGAMPATPTSGYPGQFQPAQQAVPQQGYSVPAGNPYQNYSAPAGMPYQGAAYGQAPQIDPITGRPVVNGGIMGIG